MLLSAVIDKWTELILPTYKPSTRADVRSQLRCYILPQLGHEDVLNLGAERLQRFLAGLPVSPRRARVIIMTLRAIWRKARVWGYVTGNPMSDLTFPRPLPSQRRSFSVSDIHRILKSASEPYRTIYWLAAETGLRIGEICGIKEADIVEGRLTVARNITRGGSGSPKTARGIRTLAISAALYGRIRAEGERRRAISAAGNRSDYVFQTKRGTPLDGGNLSRRHLKPLLKRLGIEGSFHSFRHANASMMDVIGAPMKARQERLGHASAKTTMDMYTHRLGDGDHQIAESLGGMINER